MEVGSAAGEVGQQLVQATGAPVLAAPEKRLLAPMSGLWVSG